MRANHSAKGISKCPGHMINYSDSGYSDKTINCHINIDFQCVTSWSYQYSLAPVAQPSLVFQGQTAAAKNIFKSIKFVNLYKLHNFIR